MWTELKKHFRASFVALILMTVLTGLAYPLAVTALAQLFMSHAANGSMIEEQGKTVGSELLGQPFTRPDYFWGRFSATSPDPDNAAASSGSNQGPTNPAFIQAVTDRITSLSLAQLAVDKKASAQATTITLHDIPVDLVTASGSGLDPDISPAAALFQVARVAKARGLSEDAVRKLVTENMSGRDLGVLGEPRVNVLKLNLALDRAKPGSNTQPAASSTR